MNIEQKYSIAVEALLDVVYPLRVLERTLSQERVAELGAVDTAFLREVAKNALIKIGEMEGA
jgi:hypothetical protein